MQFMRCGASQARCLCPACCILKGAAVWFRRTFSFHELAGEAVVVVNIATVQDGRDENFEDIRKVCVKHAPSRKAPRPELHGVTSWHH